MRVYISGPMTGLPDYNRDAFDDAKTELKAQGHVTWNPADNIDQAISEGWDHQRCMRVCLDELTRTWSDGTAVYDAIWMLPGWRGSRGATVEHLVAKACGIEVMGAELS